MSDSQALTVYQSSQDRISQSMSASLTPREIVNELDKHIIGQVDANQNLGCAVGCPCGPVGDNASVEDSAMGSTREVDLDAMSKGIQYYVCGGWEHIARNCASNMGKGSKQQGAKGMPGIKGAPKGGTWGPVKGLPKGGGFQGFNQQKGQNQQKGYAQQKGFGGKGDPKGGKGVP